MSREQYQVPTANSGQTFGGAGGQKSYADDSLMGAEMSYLCGDCGVKLALRRGEPIRCQECGCRVLYKERTKR